MPASPLDVQPLTYADAEACDHIICTLPHRFGNEAGRQACALAPRTSAGWVAVLQGHVVGFITMQPHFPTTAEITWMAVQAELRGHGIGRHLIQLCRS